MALTDLQAIGGNILFRKKVRVLVFAVSEQLCHLNHPVEQKRTPPKKSHQACERFAVRSPIRRFALTPCQKGMKSISQKNYILDPYLSLLPSQ